MVTLSLLGQSGRGTTRRSDERSCDGCDSPGEEFGEAHVRAQPWRAARLLLLDQAGAVPPTTS